MWIVRSVVLEMREDWTGDCRIWPHFLPVGEVVGLRSQEELLNSKSQGPGEKTKKKKKKKKNTCKGEGAMKHIKERMMSFN